MTRFRMAGDSRTLMKTEIAPRALDTAKAELKQSAVVVNM